MKAGKHKEPPLPPMKWVPYAVVAGMWLRRMRQRAGVTMSTAAERSHIPFKKYWNYENGETEMLSGEVLRIMPAIGDTYAAFHALVGHTISALKAVEVEVIPAKAPLPPNNPLSETAVASLTAEQDLRLAAMLVKAAHP